MKTSKSSEALSQLGAKKIAFPPKPYGRTDISNYRVASLPIKIVVVVKYILYVLQLIIT